MTACIFRSNPRCSATPDMSASKAARRRPRARRKIAPAAVLPLTVSRPALLQAGSDRRFRALVHDLLTVSTRMEIVRAHLGDRIGMSGPQYSVLIAVAHLQEADGVSVGAVAEALHVSNAFIASETGKLAQRGLLDKRTNPNDRRGVLVSMSPAGRPGDRADRRGNPRHQRFVLRRARQQRLCRAERNGRRAGRQFAQGDRICECCGG